MAIAARRVWCSCTIINYLTGKPEAEPCRQLIDHIKTVPSRQVEIIVSILAEAEVVKMEGALDDESERRILEFFGRDYVIRAPLDVPVAEMARRLVRTYSIKPLDAVHIATAVHHNIPVLETFDQEMIDKVDGKEGNPKLTIRNPLYDGPAPPPTQAGLFAPPSSPSGVNP